ncbi:head GIN domain-containing protein [Flavobacterium aquiphilum]|uniref:head GIN domain-containing protein n=1 Tax=Flavobacterium aquiphilum TaxID=3003261 RepID=UPI002480BBD7|nr:head GIN domain-containing protein [Flavobacterium aquiphilum]
MKRTFQLVFLSVLVFTVATNAQTKVKGNGKVISEKRTTAGYDEINVSGFYDVVLVSGAEGAITIEGEENILPHVKIEVVGNVLKIYNNNVSFDTKKDVTVTVPFEQIKAVSLSGSGDISTKNTISAPTFKAKLSGSGDLNLDVKSTDFEMSLTGSGDVVLKGSSNNFTSKTSGSGDVDAVNLTTKKANVTVSGSGDMKLNCTENLFARVSGSGDIEYKGNPKIKDTKVSGSGEISKI